ncbi:uncharacterized protein MONOS_11911 [Monocercomonoides exilis]|uniref:uncharacterized protein n=1 Tax=Monocercomonoides exilis TaxID=2049356 RepID=UPI0035594AC7|nr:hypothetical protein MONOS_11911 [Monocercomonoides exilis]|eukprot:MONOS_11911.1-p1 / transcript=MONOS_11911.1 / gene=MONOS_11911 / organism=Monocercomonoides_exilis_PA203 / gene_product=unspecified product / transcript_product=unspecified product / location=Mono_scaffold00624:14368-15687(-) / protein_length=372 / sequence_SO=supercontig / SO=protein_coding / is_pseudo=false
MELMGKSIVSVLEQGELQDEPQELNAGEDLAVNLRCCTLHSLLQNAPSEPSIISCIGSEPCSVSVQNTSMKNCKSSQSESGGGMIMSLSEGGAELFDLDFRAPFVREFAMCGCAAPDYADEQDLLLLVVVYQSETIFASSTTDNASDSQQRGAMSEPFISLNEALPHIIPSVYSSFLIDKSAEVTGEASACDVWLKSLDEEGERGNVVLNSSIGSKTKSLVSCSSRVKMEFLTFLFGSAFSSSHSSLLLLADENLSISDAAFSQEDSNGNSEMKLNCSIILVENGRLSINGCTFSFFSLSSSYLAARGVQYCSYMNLNISDMNSSALLDFRNLANLFMSQVLIFRCIFDRSPLVLRNYKDSQLQNIQMKGT